MQFGMVDILGNRQVHHCDFNIDALLMRYGNNGSFLREMFIKRLNNVPFIPFALPVDRETSFILESA